LRFGIRLSYPVLTAAALCAARLSCVPGAAYASRHGPEPRPGRPRFDHGRAPFRQPANLLVRLSASLLACRPIVSTMHRLYGRKTWTVVVEKACRRTRDHAAALVLWRCGCVRCAVCCTADGRVSHVSAVVSDSFFFFCISACWFMTLASASPPRMR
jgi:hypothetical protein